MKIGTYWYDYRGKLWYVYAVDHNDKYPFFIKRMNDGATDQARQGWFDQQTKCCYVTATKTIKCLQLLGRLKS